MSDMEKIAAQVPGILVECRNHLRKMASTLVESEEKCTELGRELRLHKIARDMEKRQIDDELDFEEKIAKLASIPTNRLESFETALTMRPGGFKLGSLQDQEESSAGTEGLSSNEAQGQLDSWIASNAAYG